jgi:hypothetical protein
MHSAQLHTFGNNDFDDTITSPGNVRSANLHGFSFRKNFPGGAAAAPAPGGPPVANSDPLGVAAAADPGQDDPGGAAAADPGGDPAADPGAGVDPPAAGGGGAGGAVPPAGGARRPAAPLPPTPAQVAQLAAARLQLPDPVVEWSPRLSLHDGAVRATVVNAHTWYWVDSASWRPVQQSLTVRGVAVTVTATPTSLSVDPGDGSDSVDCAGSGTVRTAAYGSRDVPSPSGCEHVYDATASDGVSAQFRLGWSVSFTGPGGATGALGAQATAAAAQLDVVQVRAVLVDPDGD